MVKRRVLDTVVDTRTKIVEAGTLASCGGPVQAAKGWFDVLTAEHCELLQQARPAERKLLVLVYRETEDRPAPLPAYDRAQMVAALACVDFVCIAGASEAGRDRGQRRCRARTRHGCHAVSRRSPTCHCYPNAARRSPPRILVVRFGAMGDIIQTLPAVADLRRAVPDAKIVWAVDGRWRELLAGNPDVDEFVSVPLRQWLRSGSRSGESAEEALRALRGNDFDLALDMQGLIKSAAVAAASNAKTVAGLDHRLLREPLAALLYDRRLETARPHVVDRYRELAAMATGCPPLQEPRFALPPGELRAGLPESYVLASTQAGWGAKQWPAGAL